jgi:type II secretory pathway pseudopilin PulG
LAVLAILALLASLLLPAVTRARTKSQTQRARLEIAQLAAALTEYQAAYGQFPVSEDAKRLSGIASEDLTYGGILEETHTWIAGPCYLTNNSELMASLLDLEQYGDGVPTINHGHVKNPRRIRFVEARQPGGTNAAPGVGVDGVYRDPWGGPDVITLDLNGDGRARDVVYREPAVSQDPADPNRGLCGLVRETGTNGNPAFEAPEPVMIWSAGPDRHLGTSQKADQGVNRDNILSWAR